MTSKSSPRLASPCRTGRLSAAIIALSVSQAVLSAESRVKRCVSGALAAARAASLPGHTKPKNSLAVSEVDGGAGVVEAMVRSLRW